MAALVMLNEYYREPCGGYSIPASEHSTMTTWGREKELDAMRNMLHQYPTGLVACVSDSYNIWDACEKYWGTELKDLIEKRDGQLIVRPDSGDLPDTVIQVLEKLEGKFGSSQTSTGHKRLPDCIRVIQGDGIDIRTLRTILKAMKEKGWAADNLGFGSGGALLQKLHRDIEKCAFKCSYVKVNGEGVDVVKDPITDPGKKSKKGRLTLENKNGAWTTVVEGKGAAKDDQLIEVFSNGELLIEHTFADIRNRAVGGQVATKQVPKILPAKANDYLNNIIILTDSYKVTHHLQYPPNTETIYSYFESRGGAFEEVCFFGLQYFLKKYLVGSVVTPGKIAVAERYFRSHLSHPVWGYNDKLFNRKGWEYIVSEHSGKLPIIIKAVPEGTVLPYKNVLFTMTNTDQNCFWLTNYLETLLVQVWYPMTVCTQSREQKKIIVKYLRATGGSEVLEKKLHLFKLHDFGFRGVSSVESAATGGAAHLVNFSGSDTMAALVMLKEYYGESCAGFSIPASEHSTMTSWGREKECEAMKNMLEKYPKGLVACVSDSYNIWDACEKYWGTELKELVEKREGQLVVRPDSGELPGTVLQVLDKLEGKFGSDKTSTGHKLLPQCIRVIQGDGIDINSLETILRSMKDKGWAADNLVFGSGGALLQKLHRDTLKCAFKCSFAKVNGEGVDVVKDPITDPGKKSKKGKLTLELRDNAWVTVTEGKGVPDDDKLVEVFRHGELQVDEVFSTIRERAEFVTSL